ENNDKVNEKVDEVGKDVSKVEGRVTKVENKVTDEAIISKVTSSEKWKQQTNSINGKATQADIDKSIKDLEFGGKNLMSGTDFSIEENVENLVVASHTIVDKSSPADYSMSFAMARRT